MWMLICFIELICRSIIFIWWEGKQIKKRRYVFLIYFFFIQFPNSDISCLLHFWYFVNSTFSIDFHLDCLNWIVSRTLIRKCSLMIQAISSHDTLILRILKKTKITSNMKHLNSMILIKSKIFQKLWENYDSNHNYNFSIVIYRIFLNKIPKVE